MNYKVVVTRRASEDQVTAYNYYEEVRAGLGDEFLDEFEFSLERLLKNPFAYGYADTRNIIRDIQIPRFPFVIIFEIFGDSIIVLSVHNTHKKSLF